MTKKTKILSLCLGALLSACGDDDGASPIAVGDLATEYENHLCDFYVRCGVTETAADCHAALDMSADLTEYIAGVNAGTLTYDATAAGQCVTLLAPTSCEYGAGPNEAEVEEVCNSVFIGTVAIGGACNVDNECVTANCDKSACSDACCAGVCAEAEPGPTIVPAGGDCSPDDAECAEGTFPKYAGLTCVCTTLVAANAACAYNDQCVAPYFCVGADAPDTLGTCVELPAQGEACAIESYLQCARFDNYCDPTTNTCVAKTPVGGACDIELDDNCVGYADCVDSVCTARPTAGEACTLSGMDCIADLECMKGDAECTATDTGCVCGLPPATTCP